MTYWGLALTILVVSPFASVVSIAAAIVFLELLDRYDTWRHIRRLRSDGHFR